MPEFERTFVEYHGFGRDPILRKMAKVCLAEIDRLQEENDQIEVSRARIARHCEYLTFENERLQEKAAHLREALDEIANPVAAMRRRLKEGEELNGQYAVMLSESSEHLKSIARKALEPL
jgi:chromosome segregation ATPase